MRDSNSRMSVTFRAPREGSFAKHLAPGRVLILPLPLLMDQGHKDTGYKSSWRSWLYNSPAKFPKTMVPVSCCVAGKCHSKKSVQRPRMVKQSGASDLQALQRNHVIYKDYTEELHNPVNLRQREGKVAHRPGPNPVLAMLTHGVPGSWGAAALLTHCSISQVCGMFTLLCMLYIYNFTLVGCCLGILTGSCTGLLLSEVGLGMRLSKLLL